MDFIDFVGCLAITEVTGTLRAKSASMLGERLRDRSEELIAKYVARMRSEPRIPNAKELSQPVLEDHAMSLLGDVFQSIVILERATELRHLDESYLLKDGSQIQRLVAELHGRQRFRMGWTQDALNREYEILQEEITALLKRQSQADVAEHMGWAHEYMKHLVDRAHKASFAAFGAAVKESPEHEATPTAV
jgi:hypothetical protein